MEFIIRMIMKVVNRFRPDYQVRQIRGRWCSIHKMSSIVYKVSVIDTVGNLIGVRFIVPKFKFEKEIDKAVHSVIKTRATY